MKIDLEYFFKIVFLVIAFFVLYYFIAIDSDAGEVADTYLSEEIQASCREYGLEYGICPELLESLIEAESSGQQSATNGSCYGICQISTIHGEHYTTEDLQIDKCCQMLLEFLEEEPDIAYSLDRFNGNSKAKYNYDNGILSDYSKKILNRSAELERIHGK